MPRFRLFLSHFWFFLARFWLINLSFHSCDSIIYTSFVCFLFAKSFSWHANLFIFGSVVLATLFDELDRGVLKDEWFFVFVVRARLVLVIGMAIGVFEDVSLCWFGGDIWGNFEVHAGGMRFVGRVERLIFVAKFPLFVQVYH